MIHIFLILSCMVFTADESSSSGAKRRPPGISAKASPEEPKSEQGTSLRRACSLSDLNKPNVPRRILPAPPANGRMIKSTTTKMTFVLS